MALLVELYLQFAGTLPTALSESVYDQNVINSYLDSDYNSQIDFYGFCCFFLIKESKEMENYVKQVIMRLENHDIELLEYIRDLSRRTCMIHLS